MFMLKQYQRQNTVQNLLLDIVKRAPEQPFENPENTQQERNERKRERVRGEQTQTPIVLSEKSIIIPLTVRH